MGLAFWPQRRHGLPRHLSHCFTSPNGRPFASAQQIIEPERVPPLGTEQRWCELYPLILRQLNAEEAGSVRLSFEERVLGLLQSLVLREPGELGSMSPNATSPRRPMTPLFSGRKTICSSWCQLMQTMSMPPRSWGS